MLARKDNSYILEDEAGLDGDTVNALATMRLPSNHEEILRTFNRIQKLGTSITLLELAGGQPTDIMYFKSQKKSYEHQLDGYLVSNESKEYLMWLKLRT